MPTAVPSVDFPSTQPPANPILQVVLGRHPGRAGAGVGRACCHLCFRGGAHRRTLLGSLRTRSAAAIATLLWGLCVLRRSPRGGGSPMFRTRALVAPASVEAARPRLCRRSSPRRRLRLVTLLFRRRVRLLVPTCRCQWRPSSVVVVVVPRPPMTRPPGHRFEGAPQGSRAANGSAGLRRFH